MLVPSLLKCDLRLLAQEELDPVDIAIVDSGIDSSHPDLQGRVVSARRFFLDGQVVSSQELPTDADNDAYGHGTAVASIIARMAPNARIHDIRVLELGNQGSGLCLLEGFRHAIEQNYKVVNLSLAVASKFSEELSAACEDAYYQGQIVVAAKRNVPITNQGIPAEFASTISVDCAEQDDPWKIVFMAGNRIEFMAQGEQVVVAAKGGGYTTLTGTSFATPVIAALCTLYAGKAPQLRPFEAKTLLKQHAHRLAADESASSGSRALDENVDARV